MTEILTDLTPPSLATAVKANLYAFFQAMRDSAAATTQDSAHGFRWHTAFPHSWFNGVLSTRPPEGDIAQLVAGTVAYFQERDVPSFSWWLSPSLEPAAWSPHLLPHGFHYDDSTPGMAVDLSTLPPPAPPPLAIRQVKDRDTLNVWARILVRSAMTLAPLYEARALGYRAAILQSSEMGYRVYRRLGFQKQCQIDYFYWRDPRLEASA
jgi:hypothetical protein